MITALNWLNTELFVYTLLLRWYHTSVFLFFGFFFLLGVFHSLIETGFVLLVELGADVLIPDFNYPEEQP